MHSNYAHEDPVLELRRGLPERTTNKKNLEDAIWYAVRREATVSGNNALMIKNSNKNIMEEASKKRTDSDNEWEEMQNSLKANGNIAKLIRGISLGKRAKNSMEGYLEDAFRRFFDDKLAQKQAEMMFKSGLNIKGQLIELPQE